VVFIFGQKKKKRKKKKEKKIKEKKQKTKKKIRQHIFSKNFLIQILQTPTKE